MTLLLRPVFIELVNFRVNEVNKFVEKDFYVVSAIISNNNIRPAVVAEFRSLMTLNKRIQNYEN